MRPSISELLALPGSWVVNNPKKMVVLVVLASMVMAVLAALGIYPGGVSQY